MTQSHRLSILVLWVALIVGAMPKEGRAQVCPAVTGDFDEQAQLAMKTSDNSCDIPDGGYAKVNTTLRLHVESEVAGWCQTFIRVQGQCVPAQCYLRLAASTTQKMDAGATGQYPVLADQGVQHYNTCEVVGGSCTSVGTTHIGSTWLAHSSYGLGPHTYTSINRTGGGTIGFGSQYCNMLGFQFAEDDPITVNILKCEPKWETGQAEYDPDDPLVHFAPTEIEIYTELTGNGITDAIAAAAASWESALAGTGMTFTPTATDCGTAANCLRVVSAALTNRCAEIAANWSVVTGVVTGNAVLTLDDDWTSYGANGLERAIAHEMGHLLGLDDQSGCEAADSVMRDGLACNTSTATPEPTINNYTLVTQTVLGGGPRNACGF